MSLKTISLFIILFFSLSSAMAQQMSYYSNDYIDDIVPTYTDEDIQSRLKNLDLCIPARFNTVVRSYIRTYSITGRSKSRKILGRAVQYFPIFEKYIQERKLPEDLKYLPVLESALDPHAVSRSNAVGLWQFMSPTAREYGLTINSTVDERRDPHRSTQAALEYLHKLYKRYGDWALALAAYNSGPGRVNRAIKRGRSKNYWTIRKYLPRETRNYVPAFIAAAYLMNYYHDHNLKGLYPDLDLQITDVVRVYEGISFQNIAAITGIPTYTVEALNPSYRKRYIPSNPLGNYLILPQRVMGSFIQYQRVPDRATQNLLIASPIPAPSHPNDNFFKTKYVVHEGETIDEVASIFKCNSYNIRAWNALIDDTLQTGQELIIYQPYVSVEYGNSSKRNKKQVASSLKKYNAVSIAIPETPLLDTSQKARRTLTSLTNESYLYYRINRGESLLEIANKFPGVTLDDILTLNDISLKKKLPKPGSRIKIKQYQ